MNRCVDDDESSKTRIFTDSIIPKLRRLSNEARQLGSSAGIVSAASRLRERLRKIWLLFFQNASKLFSWNLFYRSAQLELAKHKHSGYVLPAAPADLPSWEPDHVSEELHAFSRDVASLLECFTQFPEFVDEVPDKSLAEDLEVCLFHVSLIYDLLTYRHSIG